MPLGQCPKIVIKVGLTTRHYATHSMRVVSWKLTNSLSWIAPPCPSTHLLAVHNVPLLATIHQHTTFPSHLLPSSLLVQWRPLCRFPPRWQSRLYLSKSPTHLSSHSCSCMRSTFAPTLPRSRRPPPPLRCREIPIGSCDGTGYGNACECENSSVVADSETRAGGAGGGWLLLDRYAVHNQALSPSSLVPPHICLLPLPVPCCLYTTETPCCCSAVFLSIPPVLLCPHRPAQCCRLLPIPHMDSFVQITGYFSWILPSNMFAVKLNDLNLLHSVLSPTSGQCWCILFFGCLCYLIFESPHKNWLCSNLSHAIVPYLCSVIMWILKITSCGSPSFHSFPLWPLCM